MNYQPSKIEKQVQKPQPRFLKEEAGFVERDKRYKLGIWLHEEYKGKNKKAVQTH
jgi:hypothetical protein